MLKKRKTLTEAEVRYFMWQLLDAVAYMHKTKVIHRDLKLGNIFLTGSYYSFCLFNPLCFQQLI